MGVQEQRHPEVVVGNDLFYLSCALADQVKQQPLATIIVPDATTRVWLLHALVDRAASSLRIDILTPKEALHLLYDNPLTIPVLLPLLTRFFSDPDRQARYASLVQGRDGYAVARSCLLPFALKSFLKEHHWFTHHEDQGEKLWQEFVSFCPYQILSEYQPNKQNIPTILFGFSSIHPFILSRLCLLPLTTLYLLSPCMLFWEDLLSDPETRKTTQAKPAVAQKHFEEIFSDRQRVLANLGQLGRNFFTTINDLPARALYTLPQTLADLPSYRDLIAHDLSPLNRMPKLLDYLKADLLLLVGKHPSPVSLPSDCSLEVHGAYTPLREVEALKDFLCRLFGKTPLPPGSVMVLAQDLSTYAPCFEQVFGSDALSYSIVGALAPKGPLSLITMLLELLQSKSESLNWAEVVRHPVFSSSLQLSEDETMAVAEWLTSIACWGLSHEYCTQYLSQRAIVSSHEQGLLEQGKILLQDTADTYRTGITEKAAICRFLQFVEKLQHLCPLPLGKPLLLSQCASLFSFLAETFSSSHSESEALLSASHTFQKIAQICPDTLLPFADAKALLLELAQEDVRMFDLRSHIYVAEMRSAQPYPAQVVALLGMHDSEFPKHSQELVLSKVCKMAPNLAPNNRFLDNYTLIEAILSAQNLFIGYQAYAFETKEISQPSSVVTSLFSHLDANYLINNQSPSSALLTMHPLMRPVSSSLPPAPTTPILLPSTRIPNFNLGDLRYVARSPLTLYFREQYGLTKLFSLGTEIFTPQWKLRRFLEEHVGENFSPPEGVFADHEYAALEQETLSALNAMGIPKLHRVDIHALPTVTHPHFDQEARAIFLPSTSPVGSWPNMIQQGILITDEAWKKELFYRWPECVLRSYLAQSLNLPIQTQVLFTHQEKVLPLPSCTNTLQSWVNFGTAAKARPYPFTYEIIKLLQDQASPHELYEAILSHAAKTQGAWEVYASTFQPADCKTHLSEWTDWAKSLWPKELFS